MTMGKGQFESFNQEQEFNKNSNQPHFKQVGGDLTGRSELSMFLWAKYGTGKECICKFSIHARPNGLSALARGERRTALYNRGIKLCEHDQIAFELHGECSVKIGKGGFAVNGVIVAQNSEEAEAAKAEGYHLVGDLMRFNIPTSIWERKREAYKDPDMYRLGALPKMEWMDPRLKRCIEAFSLTEEDVLMIRHSFETALGEYISETITYSDILKYLDYPENECVKWVFGAVEPRRADQLTFSEYVHVICYYCMFGRKEIVRFIFGNMDAEKKYFLRKDEFKNLLEILSADTMRNPKQLILSWNRFMSPALKAIFLPGFEAFTHENPGVLWLFQLLQDKLKVKHLGEDYWSNKINQFMKAREDLGVILI